MRDIIGIQYRKCVCNRDPVVAAQSRAVCSDKIAIDHQTDSVLLKVDIAVIFLFADHIHVSLDDDRL